MRFFASGHERPQIRHTCPGSRHKFLFAAKRPLRARRAANDAGRTTSGVHRTAAFGLDSWRTQLMQNEQLRECRT
jgi:hypothetical protein